jgi:hypothetical protein
MFGLFQQRMLYVLFIGFVAVALGGCAGPLTKPPGLTCGALLPLHGPIDPTASPVASLLDDVIAEKRKNNPGGQVVISILALSGGGKYGAFGAGFLNGWSKAESDGQFVPLLREEIDVVTGISTGALLSIFATAGNLSPEQAGSATLRAQADRDAQLAYQASDAALFKKKGLLSALTSNGLVDPRGLLDVRVRESVTTYRDVIAKLPSDHKVLIGAANLTNGKFYVADMREVAQKGAVADPCYAEWLLASAAVPASFPPRFIDGHGYVDGGVTFGAFLGNDVQRVVRRTTSAGDPLASADVKINLIALFNNPITPNSPAKNPAAAVACDRSTLADAAAKCPALKNDLLTVATRSAGDIMTAQIYRDSLYRLQRELEAAGVLGVSKFIYAAPERIAAKGCVATSGDNFDRGYMDCLFQLGFETAQNPALWQNFDSVPRAARAPVRR